MNILFCLFTTLLAQVVYGVSTMQGQLTFLQRGSISTMQATFHDSGVTHSFITYTIGPYVPSFETQVTLTCDTQCQFSDPYEFTAVFGDQSITMLLFLNNKKHGTIQGGSGPPTSGKQVRGILYWNQ